MPFSPVFRKVFPCSVILATAVCSGGGGGGPMGTPVGDIRGSYAVTHTLTLEGLGFVACPGVLTVTNQTGTTFSGTITISNVQGCEGVASQGTISGTVTSQGVLMFTVSLPIIESLLALADCEIVGGSATFTGTATTSGLSATRTNELECADGSGGQVAYTVSGQKT